MEQVAYIETRRANAGFSFIEILAVLAILSLVASIIVFNAPPGRSDAQRDATVFAAALQQAIDHTSISATPMRIDFNAGKYVFLEYSGGAWRPYSAFSARDGGDSVVELEMRTENSLLANEKILTGAGNDVGSGESIIIDPIVGARAFSVRFGVDRPVFVQIGDDAKISVSAS